MSSPGNQPPAPPAPPGQYPTPTPVAGYSPPQPAQPPAPAQYAPPLPPPPPPQKPPQQPYPVPPQPQQTYAPPIPAQQPYPPQQQTYAAQQQEDQGKVEKKETRDLWTNLEKWRYTLYGMCFVFGVATWSIVASDLYTTFLGERFCYLTGSFLEGEPGACVAVISVGVVLMIVLIGLVGWHSMKHYERMYLPNRIEMISFAGMAVVWLVLFIVMIAVTEGIFREVRETRAAISTSFFAMLAHGGVAYVAFRESKEESGEGGAAVSSA